MGYIAYGITLFQALAWVTIAVILTVALSLLINNPNVPQKTHLGLDTYIC
jgi:hypothetical protein